MFGEEALYGVKEVGIDAKRRIVLPSFTKAEQVDKLVIQKDEEELKIIPEDRINKIIEDMQSALFLAKSEQEFRMLKKRLDKFCVSILSVRQCDGQRRLLLPDNYFESEDTNKIMVVGFKDHVKLFTKKRYEDYLKG